MINTSEFLKSESENISHGHYKSPKGVNFDIEMQMEMKSSKNCGDDFSKKGKYHSYINGQKQNFSEKSVKSANMRKNIRDEYLNFNPTSMTKKTNPKASYHVRRKLETKSQIIYDYDNQQINSTAVKDPTGILTNKGGQTGWNSQYNKGSALNKYYGNIEQNTTKGLNKQVSMGASTKNTSQSPNHINHHHSHNTKKSTIAKFMNKNDINQKNYEHRPNIASPLSSNTANYMKRSLLSQDFGIQSSLNHYQRDHSDNKRPGSNGFTSVVNETSTNSNYKKNCQSANNIESTSPAPHAPKADELEREIMETGLLFKRLSNMTKEFNNIEKNYLKADNNKDLIGNASSQGTSVTDSTNPINYHHYTLSNTNMTANSQYQAYNDEYLDKKYTGKLRS